MSRALPLVALLSVGAALMAARPGSEFQLVTQLNGQPIRVRMADGGAWGVFTVSDGGAANSFGCAPITNLVNVVGGAVSANVLVFVPLQAMNFCVMPSAQAPLWDGGCSVVPTDINYGWPVAAGVPQYVTPDSVAQQICFTTDAGSITQPIGWAQ